MTRRMRPKSWTFPRWGDYGIGRNAEAVRMCDWQGCTEKGDCPAPKFRDSDEKYWFCQEHAGLYNRNWNYFRGMTEEEAQRTAEKESRKARGYHEAGTWDFVGAGLSKEDRERQAALDALELDETATQAEIKSAYRTLAKKYHPDTNPGDEEAADRFKAIGTAYALLKE